MKSDSVNISKRIRPDRTTVAKEVLADIDDARKRAVNRRSESIGILQKYTRSRSANLKVLALFYLGNIYETVEPYEFEKAVKIFEKCKKLFPKWPEPIFDRAIALVRLGRFEEAVEEYDKAESAFEEAGATDKAVNGYLYGRLYLFRAEARVALCREEEAKKAISEIGQANRLLWGISDERREFWLRQIPRRLENASDVLMGKAKGGYQTNSIEAVNEVPKVFLCHSKKDESFVKRLAENLKAEGVPVWFDDWAIKVGDSLRQKIEEGIETSGVFAIVLSPDSVKSGWVQKELDAALAREVEEKQGFILPVMYKDCRLTPFLKGKKYADFRSPKPYEEGFKELLESIKGR